MWAMVTTMGMGTRGAVNAAATAERARVRGRVTVTWEVKRRVGNAVRVRNAYNRGKRVQNAAEPRVAGVKRQVRGVTAINVTGTSVQPQRKCVTTSRGNCGTARTNRVQ